MSGMYEWICGFSMMFLVFVRREHPEVWDDLEEEFFQWQKSELDSVRDDKEGE